MRFKIRKEQFEVLQSVFKKLEIPFEIDLELVPDTASEAMINRQIETSAFHKGYHRGFKEGFFEGRKKDVRFCRCGCGGNNCFMRHCDEKCHLFNI